MSLQALSQTLQLIERIDTLIQRRATGSPGQMACRLGISRSTWFNYLSILTEELNFPIDYDRQEHTYFYTKPGSFKAGFVVSPYLNGTDNLSKAAIKIPLVS